MTKVVICPRCGERVVANEHDVDIQHKCNTANEYDVYDDVLNNMPDENGTGKYVNLNLQGFGSNKSKWTDQGLEGERNYDLTIRGARSSTHRQTRHREHIDLR